VYCVSADAQGFDDGERVEIESGGGMELVGRHLDPFAHAAIDVDAQNPEPRAAVSAAARTRVALTTIQIRLDRATVSRKYVRHVRADVSDLDSELVTKDSGIREERLLASPRVKVRAADADSPHTHAGTAWARRRRF